MKYATIAAVILTTTWNVFAQTHIESLNAQQKDDIGLSASPSLAKSVAQSASTDTFYAEATPMMFVPPVGWQYTVMMDMGTITWLVAESPFYNAFVNIFSSTYDTEKEAELAAGSGAFSDLEWCMERTATLVPHIYYLEDTTVNNIRFCFVECKYKDAHDSIRVAKEFSSKLCNIGVSYVASVTDYNANSAQYNKVYQGTYFWNNTTLAKSVQRAPTDGAFLLKSTNQGFQVSLHDQSIIKADLYDLFGRRCREVFAAQERKAIDVNLTGLSKQKMILRVTGEDKQEYERMLPSVR